LLFLLLVCHGFATKVTRHRHSSSVPAHAPWGARDRWAGATHRTLRNGTLVRWESAGCPSPGKRPGEGDIVATGPDGRRLSRYSADVPRQGYQGTLTDLAMYAGQGVGDVKDVPSAPELVDRLWMECLAARP
jgi:hypothetical protein